MRRWLKDGKIKGATTVGLSVAPDIMTTIFLTFDVGDEALFHVVYPLFI